MSTTDKEYLQELYERVKESLLSQGKKSVRNGICRYRSPGGLKCAVGLLIADSEYSKDLESEGLHGLSLQEALKRSGVKFSTEVRQLLMSLQYVHDNTATGGASARRSGVLPAPAMQCARNRRGR